MSTPAGLRSRPLDNVAVTSALICSDILALCAGFAIAYLIRFQSGWGFFYEHSESRFAFYAKFGIWLVPLFLVIFACYRLYDTQRLFDGVWEYSKVVSATTLSVMLVVLMSFLVDSGLVIARGWIVTSWITVMISTLGARFVLRRAVYAARRSGHLRRRVIIVGADNDAINLADRIRQARSSGMQVVGIIDSSSFDRRDSPNDERLSLRNLIISTNANAIVVSAASVSQSALSYLVREVSQLPTDLHLVPGMHEILTTGVQVGEVNGLPLVTMNKVRITGFDLALKRMLDYSIASLTLLVLGPIMLTIMLAIRITSPGPIFHRRTVIGQQGQRFAALKFRTMYVDGAAILQQRPELVRELERHGKLVDDPRVTPIGRALRRWSLDELPQLLNVLRGQMSLVGPRMITESELDHFGHWRENLCTVKPGLTGLWQVSGRSKLGYEDRVRLDMHYIRSYSIWSDIEILLRTVPAVFHGTGAY